MKWVFAAVGVACIVGCGPPNNDRELIQQEALTLPAEMKEAESIGFIFDPARFDRHVPASENALPLYLAASKKLTDSGKNPLNGPGSGQERQFLAACKPGIALADSASAKPFFDSRVDFSRGAFNPPFFQYGQLKYLAKVLCLNAEVSAEAGDYEQMGKDYGDVGRMAGQVLQDRMIIGTLVAIAIGQIGFRSMEATLGRVKGERVLGAIRASLQTYPAKIDFSRALIGDALLFDRTLVVVGSQPGSAQGSWVKEAVAATEGKHPEEIRQAKELDSMEGKNVLAAFRARYIESWVGMVQAARSNTSYANKAAGMQRLARKEETGDITYFYIQMLGGNEYGQLYAACENYGAARRVFSVGLSLLTAHDEDGKWPAALPPSAPTDPFSGKPLAYRPTSTRFTVYSVGPNMKDDGGKARPQGDDVVFSYPYSEPDPASYYWKGPGAKQK